jgi:hypothetical protein
MKLHIYLLDALRKENNIACTHSHIIQVNSHKSSPIMGLGCIDSRVCSVYQTKETTSRYRLRGYQRRREQPSGNKNNSVVCSPQANYTDRPTATAVGEVSANFVLYLATDSEVPGSIPALPDFFLRSSESGTQSTQPREDN